MSIDVKMTGRTLLDEVPVRAYASSLAGVIKTLSKDKKVKITKQTEDAEWSYSSKDNGWILNSFLYITDDEETKENKKKISKLSKEEQKAAAEKEIKSIQKAELNAKQAIIQQQDLDNQLNIIGKYINDTMVDDKAIVDSLLVNNLNGVYGIPYQFLESVDPRLPDSVMGRKYSEKIIAKMPLLCITPGTAQFMSNFTKEEKQAGLTALLEGGSDTPLNNIIHNNGRYFTFAFDYENYFEYVNGLCRAGAKFLNIQDEEIDIGGSKARAADFNWINALNKNLKATFTSQEFIGFYMDSTDSVSENFSNDTTQSQLSSALNGVSDLAREIGFLLGAGADKTIQIKDEGLLNTTLESIDDLSRKYLNGGLLTNIANNFSTIAVGGKLLFPEIWADSSFSRNFDITIKLRTPDADVMSWYLNLYVPLCHLVALVAGHQTDNPNGYYSPFLVRAFYKGLFNIDLGIVTDMSITKGKEAAWNVYGLPTEIDVNMTIKDLYNMLSIVPGNEPKNFVTNTIMMDYIANTCGININQMDIQRSLAIYWILSKDRAKDLPNKITMKFQDVIDTYAMNLYDKFQNKFLL